MKINKFFPKVVGEFSNVFGTDAVNNMVSEVEELSKHGTWRNGSLNVESSHQTIQTIHRLPAFKPLTKKILENSSECLQACGYHEFLTSTLRVTNMWFNVSGKGDYLFPHTHPGSICSGAYYLDSDESHKISFYDPYKNIIEHPQEINDISLDVVSMPCSIDTMYLFSSDFHHGVTQQKSDARKIVISFNLCFASC